MLRNGAGSIAGPVTESHYRIGREVESISRQVAAHAERIGVPDQLDTIGNHQ